MDWDEYLQPAIFAFTGKPGAGKSYFSTRLIIAEIKGRNRNIVTNIPVNRKKLREYVGKDFYIYDLETFTDNRFFFTQRGDYSYELEEGGDETVDFSKYLEEDDKGVVYIIDEAHLYFNSRNWKFMAQGTLSFFTFIRHCGDTLVYLTQKFSDVDSQLRGKTQSFNLLRNLAKEKLGWFKRGSGFRIYQYLREKDIEAMQKPTQDFTFPFKLSIAECYSTSLFNRNFDEKFKIKGITIKQLIVAIGLIIAGFVYWVAQGGILESAQDLVPDIASTTFDVEKEFAGKGGVELVPPPLSAPIEFVEYELPVGVMPGLGQRFQNISQAKAEKYDALVFGEKRECKLSFYVEKLNDDTGFDASFDMVWRQFSTINALGASLSSFSGSVNTDLFSTFMVFAKDKSHGTTLKEVTLILKESVPCILSQGYEIPMARTIATQGVQSTNYEYRQVGFDLVLVMEAIRGRELISVNVSNTQILDLSTDVPTMLSFKTENLFDVIPGKTYEIAQFESNVSEDSKKLLGRKKIERRVNNRVFLSYGQ